MKSRGEQKALERLGENLRFQRVMRRQSQEALAFRAEMHRTQFSLIENGERTPRVLTLVKLCGSLGLTTDDLLEGIAWVPADHREGRFEVSDAELWKT